MNAFRLSAAALLAAGAYVLWQRHGVVQQYVEDIGGETAGEGYSVSDILDEVSEVATGYTGISFPSSGYRSALANPRHAQIIGFLTDAERRNGIPSGLLVRQAWQESRFNPSAVNASSGAAGLMQFMPATAAEWGVAVFDAKSSADGAGRYMAWLFDRVGSWPLALAAYNWGVGNVLRKGMGAAPSETRNYVAQIGAALGLS